MFPNDLWKQFTLETHTTISYGPWIMWEYKYPYYPAKTDNPYPWYTWTTGGTNLDFSNTELVEGVYNVNVTI